MKINDYFLRQLKKYPQFASVKNYEPICVFGNDSSDLQENALLDVIYSLDPETKLVKGDIALFLSSKTSSEIRQYISDNLHGDVADSPVLPDGVDASRYLREKGEDRNSYFTRLQKTLQEDLLKEKELKKVTK